MPEGGAYSGNALAGYQAGCGGKRKLLAGLIGVVVTVLEVFMARGVTYMPSATAVGLSFILPASVPVMLAAGALITWLVSQLRPHLAELPSARSAIMNPA